MACLTDKHVLRANGLAARIRHHLENRPSEFAKRRILARERERLGIQDQLANHSLITPVFPKIRPK